MGENMSIDAIILRNEDNVATALADLQPGQSVTAGIGDGTRTLEVREPIPYGHKFAVRDLAAGEDVIKYGEVIGRTTHPIPCGAHAHVHNIESLRGRGDLEDCHERR